MQWHCRYVIKSVFVLAISFLRVWWSIERRSQNSAVSSLYRFLWLLQVENLSRARRMIIILVTTSTRIVEVQDSFKSRDVAASCMGAVVVKCWWYTMLL